MLKICVTQLIFGLQLRIILLDILTRNYTPRYIVYGVYVGITLVGRSVCRSVGRWTFLVNYISQQPLIRIQYNFTRMIDTKPCCAYCRRVALELFLNQLWPLEFLIHMYIVRHQLGVFITFSDISSCVLIEYSL